MATKIVVVYKQAEGLGWVSETIESYGIVKHYYPSKYRALLGGVTQPCLLEIK